MGVIVHSERLGHSNLFAKHLRTVATDIVIDN